MYDEDVILQKDWNSLDEFLSAYYDARILTKSDTNAYSGTTNYRNWIYGKKLWGLMNQKPNAFSAIPKEPWNQSGYRLVQSYATVETTGIGIAESTSTIPDALVPTVDVLKLTPKTMVNPPIAITLAQLNLARSDDVATWDGLQGLLAREFPMHINGSLLKDNDTLAGNHIESIDRAIGSYAEIAACGQTAGDLDYGGLDRDAAATAWDAYVNHNSNTDREFKLSLLDSLFTNCMPYWDAYAPENKFMLMGFDTIERMQSLAMSQQRWDGWQNYQMSYGGVKTIPGTAIGFGVASFRGVPVIPEKMINVDTIGRSYLIDGNYLKIGVLVPPTYIDDRNYLARNQLTNKATYYMIAELVANMFRCHGKVRDCL